MTPFPIRREQDRFYKSVRKAFILFFVKLLDQKDFLSQINVLFFFFFSSILTHTLACVGRKQAVPLSSIEAISS